MKLLVHSVLAAVCLMVAACGSNAQTASTPPTAPADMRDVPSMTADNLAPTGEADPTGPTAPHTT